MNKFTDKSLTYGFEIEGVFTDGAIKSADKLDCVVTKKRDGSVHESNILYNAKLNRWSEYTELNLGIFNNQKDLITALETFENKKNYFMDESCGLHLHIKPKKDVDSFRELFEDVDFVLNLEKFASNNLCSCVKDRESVHFCAWYRGFDDFMRDFKGQTKYRFVRNHPSGTMEFRFFSPCIHKENNVSKFLTYMIHLLNCQEHKKIGEFELFEKDVIVQNDRYFLSAERNNDYKYKLNVSTGFEGISPRDIPF
jgi:hypothetical protein